MGARRFPLQASSPSRIVLFGGAVVGNGKVIDERPRVPGLPL